MLEVRDITVSYGNSEVLRDVSLSLHGGEVIALLGANGAGKTTLIRALNGTLPIAGGEIVLDDRSLSSLSRREIARNIAVVAQENETRFPITVLEFVLSGRFVHGGAFGWESDEDVEFARNTLKKCDLADSSSNVIDGWCLRNSQCSKVTRHLDHVQAASNLRKNS